MRITVCLTRGLAFGIINRILLQEVMAKQLNVRERTAQGSDLFGGKGWSDEDEGSLPRGRVNWPEQVQRLAAGKIERSAEAFGVSKTILGTITRNFPFFTHQLIHL